MGLRYRTQSIEWIYGYRVADKLHLQHDQKQINLVVLYERIVSEYKYDQEETEQLRNLQYSLKNGNTFDRISIKISLDSTNQQEMTRQTVNNSELKCWHAAQVW